MRSGRAAASGLAPAGNDRLPRGRRRLGSPASTVRRLAETVQARADRVGRLRGEDPAALAALAEALGER